MVHFSATQPEQLNTFNLIISCLSSKNRFVYDLSVAKVAGHMKPFHLIFNTFDTNAQSEPSTVKRKQRTCIFVV